MLHHEHEDAVGDLGAHHVLEVDVVSLDHILDVTVVPVGETPGKKGEKNLGYNSILFFDGLPISEL